jgi:hypothetical protein
MSLSVVRYVTVVLHPDVHDREFAESDGRYSCSFRIGYQLALVSAYVCHLILD